MRRVLLVLALLFAAPAFAQSGPQFALATAKTCEDFRAITKTWPTSSAAASAKAKMAQMKCVDPEAEAKRLAAEKAELEAQLAKARREAEAAKRAADQKSRDLAAALAKQAPPSAGTSSVGAAVKRAFDIDALHPDVQAAVLSARQAAQRAESVAARAHAAAERARKAQHEYKAGFSGTTTWRESDGDVYEGQGSRNDGNGFGVYTSSASGPFAGNVYRGQFVSSQYTVGIYTWGENSNNTTKMLRYEGEFLNNKKNGSGKFFWRYGESYAGDFSADDKAGFGVYVWQDGYKYEGAWAADRRDGLGVLWKADGTVSQAGRWEAEKLVQSLTK